VATVKEREDEIKRRRDEKGLIADMERILKAEQGLP